MVNEKNISMVILEDEEAHAEAIRRSLFLTAIECEILTINSLHEFNRIIPDVNPSLVIADMNLPDGDAFSILRGFPENQPWPVLVMTSHGDEETAVKAIKSGAMDYIVKSPEAFYNIQQIVNRTLREWRQIQKRVHAEAALRESEKQLRALYETMSQGVVYHDASGQITSMNLAAEKILGLTSELLQGNTSLDPYWCVIHEDGSEFPGDKHPATEALQKGVPVKDVVMGLYNLSLNNYKWVLVSAIPQFREDETAPYQVFVTLTDITERKLFQDKLQRQNIELMEAKEKAEESNRLKSAFIANLSHEIRTPMNGIMGFADLLKNEDITDKTRNEYIEIIDMSGRRMLDIINDLIDISKIEAGQIEIKSEITDINGILNELLLFFTPESNKKQIELKFNNELSADRCFIETDRIKLTQIISNLIKNALKFTCAGYIEFGCRLKGNSCLFYVKDTGIGIRKEIQEKIFERFQQGDVSIAGINEGVGLGLAITRAYVEMLGGTIKVESEPGKGSFFYFTIPYNETADLSMDSQEETAKIPESLPYLNILIVEDDEISYMLLKEMLGKNNINIYYAGNGKEAVDKCKKHPEIDLILMDIKMPQMNGLEATRQIKMMRPEITIIAQTAFAAETDIQEAMDAGCTDYIIKPISKNILLNKILQCSIR